MNYRSKGWISVRIAVCYLRRGSYTYQPDEPLLSVFRVDLRPEGLLFGLDMLRLQGLLLCPPGTPALLTPDLFGSHPFGADEPRPEPLDPVEENAAGEKAVQRLGTFLLAFYREARRQVDEEDARGGLVDLLPPGTGGTDEGFAELLLPHAEALHPFPERRIFFLRDGHGL
jgi:hypothetical protein